MKPLNLGELVEELEGQLFGATNLIAISVPGVGPLAVTGVHTETSELGSTTWLEVEET